MDILKFLEEKVNAKMGLCELIDAFHEMCKIPIGTDEVSFLETGNFRFTGEELFYFSLVRQYKNDDDEDEYVQLHLDIMFEPIKKAGKINSDIWSDEFDSLDDFFESVKASKAYHYLYEEQKEILKYDIYLDET